MRAALAMLAVAAAVLVFVGSSAPAPIIGPIALIGTVREHHPALTQTFPGRESWYYSLASARRAGRPFGYGILACAFASTRSSVRQCSGTFSLPRGKLIVVGSFLYPALYVLAVTGGTGAYTGAGGTLTARRFPNSSTYKFNFALR